MEWYIYRRNRAPLNDLTSRADDAAATSLLWAMLPGNRLAVHGKRGIGSGLLLPAGGR